MTSAFINAVAPGAKQGWTNYGVLPSLTIAQAILESGWGKSGLSAAPNYNLFGIKANGWKAPNIVNKKTFEYINGKRVEVVAAFRKYNSWAESVKDHALFLQQNRRYSNLLWKTDYKEVCKLIQQDGYATAPTYASQLIKIIEQYKLYNYDPSSSSKPTTKPTAKPTQKPSSGGKIAIGKTCQVNGKLYVDSYASRAARTVNGRYLISRIIEGRAAGVLIGGGTGWVSKSSVKC